MNNGYNEILHFLNAKDERSKHYNIFLSDAEKDQEIYNNEKFKQIYEILKGRYYVLNKLFGEKNFKLLSYEYFKYNPIQSSKSDTYGKSLPRFIETLECLRDFPYLSYIAKLDFFWTSAPSEEETISLPKGTLESWGSLYKDQQMVDIFIDENIIETLKMKKVGREVTIVPV